MCLVSGGRSKGEAPLGAAAETGRQPPDGRLEGTFL